MSPLHFITLMNEVATRVSSKIKGSSLEFRKLQYVLIIQLIYAYGMILVEINKKELHVESEEETLENR